MAGVFLSYRRAEREWANRLARNLGNRFGRDLVFQDVEDIPIGQRWRDVIGDAITGAEVILAAIGPYWLVDKQDRRRLDDPEDVLRGELVDALTRGKPIVPVLVGGAKMPNRDDIPEALAELTEREGAELADATWNADVERLLEQLRVLILPTRGSEPLSRVEEELGRLEQEFWGRHNAGESADALDTAQRTLAMLDRVSPLYPQAVFLQIMRGYSHKNRAIELFALERDEEARGELDASDRVFTTLVEEFPEEPAAWDGKGSVLAMQGHLEESLPYFDRAIVIKPDYWQPRENRKNILAELGRSG
jgi:hypothetical protein